MSLNLEDYYAQLADPYADRWESVECRTIDPEVWWFIDDIHGSVSNEQAELAAHALTVCNRCPLINECLELGMEDGNIKWGIWGGTFAGERLALGGRTRLAHDRQQIGKAKRLRARIGVERTTL